MKLSSKWLKNTNVNLEGRLKLISIIYIFIHAKMMDGKYESGRIGNFKSKIKTTQTTKKYDAHKKEKRK